MTLAAPCDQQLKGATVGNSGVSKIYDFLMNWLLTLVWNNYLYSNLVTLDQITLK